MQPTTMVDLFRKKLKMILLFKPVIPILMLISGLFLMAAIPACSDSGDQPASDQQRRQQIMSMYDGYRKSFPGTPEIEPAGARELMKTGKVVFIDERKPEEQAVSMLPNAITSQAFLRDPSRYDEYTKIAYCTISYRSGKLTQQLNQKGIKIYNLRGGILAWVHDGGTVYDSNGATGRIHVYGPKWNLAPAAYQAVW